MNEFAPHAAMNTSDTDPTDNASDAASYEDGDLTDMLSELRVLLPTAQFLTAFLITVPFSSGFSSIVSSDKDIFLALFLLALTSLVLLSAPAVQHRLMRPLVSRARFKRFATRQVVMGSCLLAAALVLATQLVLSTVLGHGTANVAASFVALLIVALWIVVPKAMRTRGHF